VQRKSTCKEFHAVGPATENELSAKRLYDGTVVQRSPDGSQSIVRTELGQILRRCIIENTIYSSIHSLYVIQASTGTGCLSKLG